MSIAAVTTKYQNLNVRSGPSINSSRIGSVARGSSIQVGPDTFSEGGWTWIQYGDGWVCQKDPRYSYAFLNISPDTVESEQAPAEPPSTETTEAPNVDLDGVTSWILNQIGDTDEEIRPTSTIPINGSAVQYEDEKYQASIYELYEGDKYDINEIWKANKYKGQMSQDQLKSLDRQSPEYMQNKSGYPKIYQFNSDKQYYEYDYKMDYDADNLSSDLQGLRKTFDLNIEGRDELYRKYTEYYNRFKLANPNDALHKTFSHVFFIRPDCNVLERSGSDFELVSGLENNPNFLYAYMKSPELLRQLTSDGGYGHDFMLYLSNRARSFQLSDEYIGYDNYGKAFTGHKVMYGKTNVESKTAGDFSITYKDDRDLHVFQLHKLWADYISNVYQGIFNPKEEYIREKILDYATSVYYIMCAEDGETVIFWSKYYGVFPVSIPSSQNSWTAGSTLTDPELEIKYQYSFKEDYNPLSLIEFNINSGNNDYNYIPVISKDSYTVNTTWVGAPFIETFNNDKIAPYTFKLRFRKGK